MGSCRGGFSRDGAALFGRLQGTSWRMRLRIFGKGPANICGTFHWQSTLPGDLRLIYQRSTTEKHRRAGQCVSASHRRGDTGGVGTGGAPFHGEPTTRTLQRANTYSLGAAHDGRRTRGRTERSEASNRGLLCTRFSDGVVVDEAETGIKTLALGGSD